MPLRDGVSFALEVLVLFLLGIVYVGALTVKTLVDPVVHRIRAVRTARETARIVTLGRTTGIEKAAQGR